MPCTTSRYDQCLKILNKSKTRQSATQDYEYFVQTGWFQYIPRTLNFVLKGK